MSLKRYSPIAEAIRRGNRVPSDVAYEPNTYAVKVPDLAVRVRDVGVDALALRDTLEMWPVLVSGRPMDLDEAHHVIWLVRRRVPMRKRYGYRLGVRLEAIGRELERRLQPRAGEADVGCQVRWRS